MLHNHHFENCQFSIRKIIIGKEKQRSDMEIHFLALCHLHRMH